jgi:ubiquinone/menaquinone biosynthesis C-methylase UbiE
LAAVLTPEHLEQLCAPAADGDGYRARVRGYYDACNATIVREVGPTYQAGLIKPTLAAPAAAENAAEASNRYLAERAGLAAGLRLLDAGCGTCGPSIDACRALPGLAVAAITISPQQASSARRLIRDAGLSERIRVHVGDYHALPFGAASFDRVWFLEAIGYAEDPARVFAEVFRVLRRGGSVYIKDVFRRGGVLTAAERLELAEFDRVYVQRTPSAEDTATALRRAGFSAVETTDLSERISMDAFNRAMWRGRPPHPAALSAFGRYHYRSFRRLPVRFVELRATKR